MTGYGRATVAHAATSAAWSIEVRSVNHRGLDLKIRSADPDAYIDVEVTRLVRTSVERGSISVSIREEGAAASIVGASRIRRAHAMLEELRHELGQTAPVDLATVAAFLALDGRSSSPLRGEALWGVLAPGLTAALAELDQTRSREGLALEADMRARLERLTDLLTALRGALEPLADRYARRLLDRLAALRDLPGYDPGRVAQEVALMADRLDVSEEVARLEAHFAHLRLLLGSSGAVGRKLDFVVQEIGREINTLGSKSQDASVAGHVIEAKSELEKIREQAQNIE